MPAPTATERKVLKAIAARRWCDHMRAARDAGISSSYGDQVCRYLLKWGYLERSGRTYTVTEAGKQAVAKELARDRKDTNPEGLAWERWFPGARMAEGRSAVLPEEGTVWETYRVAGGRTEVQERSLPEVLREDKHRCAFCKGSGYRPPGAKCPVCKGSGEVTFFEPPVVKCAYCKGTGEKERKVHITCSACRGKGFIPVKEPIEICPVCRGRGKSIDKLPCTTCKGKGVVTVKERMLS